MDRSETSAGSCCTPTEVRELRSTVLCEPTLPKEPREQMLGRMTSLRGGTFLMGTDNPEGFPQDGEGPVRPVTVDPFLMDTYPVTNELFERFVLGTGYRTEAE